MKKNSKIDSVALEKRLRRAVGDAAFFDQKSRFEASYDGSKLSFLPDAVVRPRHEQDIRRMLLLANRTRTPVTVIP